MKRILFVFVLSIVSVVFSSQFVLALPVVDQSQLLTNGGVAFWDDLHQAQTFKAGATGKLTRLDLRLGLNRGAGAEGITETVYITLSEWNINQPGNILGTTSLVLDSPSFLQNIDLTPLNINVNTGDMYSFSLYNDLSYYAGRPVPYRNTGTRVQWGTNSYTDGSLWTKYSTGWVERSGTDAVFTTYVESTSVPEPSTLFLLGTGLAGIVLIKRKETV